MMTYDTTTAQDMCDNPHMYILLDPVEWQLVADKCGFMHWIGWCDGQGDRFGMHNYIGKSMADIEVDMGKWVWGYDDIRGIPTLQNNVWAWEIYWFKKKPETKIVNKAKKYLNIQV